MIIVETPDFCKGIKLVAFQDGYERLGFTYWGKKFRMDLKGGDEKL
jgi:hypothetical protein